MKIYKVIADKKPEYCIACPVSTLHICGKPVTEHPTSGSAVTHYKPDNRCVIREVGAMLKSCKYCGKIHDSKYDCGRKPKRQKLPSEKNKFRWSRTWREKSEEIKERDNYLCQVALKENPPRYVYTDLSVHHIIPLEDDFEKRLDEENLITLSDEYHKKAERGEIKRETLFNILAEKYGYTYPPA